MKEKSKKNKNKQKGIKKEANNIKLNRIINKALILQHIHMNVINKIMSKI